MAATQRGVRIDESFFAELWSDLDTIFNDLQDSESLEELNETVSFGYLLDQKFDELVQANANYTANEEIVNTIYRTYKQVCFLFIL